MAPRKAGNVEQVKELLSAVLLADSFTQKFRPVTLERPKVQLPLVNACMIDYALEWLAASGVQEVFVFCCAHADKIQRHLADGKWLNSTQMEVKIIVRQPCLTLGEALRNIDTEDIIKNDFVLLSGDCVTNMKLSRVMEQHKKRREKNKGAIMTMVWHKASSALHRERLGENQLLLVMDKNTNRLLRCEEIDRNRLKSNDMIIDTALLSERDDIEVRCDLIDTNIYICAPEVLMLFKDNFDYQNIRRDFVTGQLNEEELGNQLYVYELEAEYAAWVRNMRSYDAVSKDVMLRWAFPFVPDTNLLHINEGRGQYQYFRKNMAREMVSNKRNTDLYPDSCIGDFTTIGKNVKMERSVVGRNVTIGDGCVIRDSYVMDSVTIGGGCSVRYSLVCEGATVHDGATVDSGTILSFRTVIGAGHEVPPAALISLAVQQCSQAEGSDDDLEYHLGDSTDYGDDEHEGPSSSVEDSARELARGAAAGHANKHEFDTDAVGANGAGYRWQLSEVEDDVARSSIGPPPPLRAAIYEEAVIAPPTASSLPLETEPAGGSAASHVDPGASWITDDEFKREVEDTFLRSISERILLDNIVLEINGLKIAEDKTFAACAGHIFTAMLDLCMPAPRWAKSMSNLFPEDFPDCRTAAGKVELLKRLKAQLMRHKELLTRFLKTEDDQVELLLTLEEYCDVDDQGSEAGARGSRVMMVFERVMQMLYDIDVVSEEAVLAWAEEKEHADEEEKRFLSLAHMFINWLKEADEEGSEEDEDEDEDEEEEED